MLIGYSGLILYSLNLKESFLGLLLLMVNAIVFWR